MLTEIRGARQIPGEGFRRWFRDERFDLIVFYPSEKMAEICGFQLCYRKNDGERVLSWYKNRGYRHSRVDDGEVPYRGKMSPIFVKDGAFDADAVLADFGRAAEKVDPEIVAVVEKRVKNLQFS